MACAESLAGNRHQFGADRDEAADGRDAESRVRDDVADQRDVAANDRDEAARRSAEVFDDGLCRIHRRLVDRFARIEATTVDPADWPDITPAGLAHLRESASEQRRLASIDRVAIRDL